MYQIDPQKCMKGGDCIRACPVGAIVTGENGVSFITADDCTDCGACEAVCDAKAVNRL